MRIGQISFFRMSSPVERPYGTLGARLEVPGPEPSRPRRPSTATSTRGREASAAEGLTDAMALNDAVHWSADLGGGHARRARPGGHVPLRRGRHLRARCRGCCGSSSSAERDRRPAPAPPGAQLPARRDAGRPGARRDRDRRAPRRARPGVARATPATPIVPALARGRLRPGHGRRRGDEPPPLRPRRRPPARRRVAGVPAGADRGPARGVGDRALATTRGSWPPTTSRSCAWCARGATRAPPTARWSCCRACRVVPTGGHTAGHQAIVVRAPGRDAGLLRRHRDAALVGQPALGPGLRRLPARLGRGQGDALRAGPPRSAGRSSSPTSCATRWAGSSPDRDRFAWEPLV